ncbi:MAG: TIGR02300 family protein [Sphingomonadaceae bacterium]|uniref:TIGR02300 family protein n=1 Tax=Thermaurantiacus sp. TaxID=2820283 RepID=UPI00298F1CC1|nr:TIGR02300 family protein [Thermaurantiacus sp.]MCS6987728.1 TIGR02300 family protein [Sphingomonadaceae bacterium]MDW8415052.1 TIGR02300 family protein [Thermaurantiacus sp.]
MIKPEWGVKRTCPKCSTRFYDLGSDDPVTCINCGHAWYPEPILKSKQVIPFEEAKTEEEAKAGEGEAAGAELDLEAVAAEEGEAGADAEIDIGDDDDLGDVPMGEEDEER